MTNNFDSTSDVWAIYRNERNQIPRLNETEAAQALRRLGGFTMVKGVICSVEYSSIAGALEVGGFESPEGTDLVTGPYFHLNDRTNGRPDYLPNAIGLWQPIPQDIEIAS